MHIILETNGMRIVHAGRPWPFRDIEPSSREVTMLLLVVVMMMMMMMMMMMG
jgi:hypothetical protein